MYQAQKRLLNDLMNPEKAKYFNDKIVSCAGNQSILFKTVDEFLHARQYDIEQLPFYYICDDGGRTTRENLVSDCFQGCFVVTCTLCAFISLVWLREQILHGRGPDWLDPEPDIAAANQRQNDAGPADQQAPAVGAEAGNQGNQRPANPVRPMNFLDMMGIEAEQEEDEEGAENNNGANPPNVALQAEDNWNPIEWDRAAEELTWERLLGLDGSLVFLEHVFWVVSLNTLFILVFAFCPYHIGHFTIASLQAEDYVTSSQFEGLVTTLLGYLVIAFSLVVIHSVVSIALLHRSRRVIGLCYVVVKVSLLVVVEIGIFPLICGWWLDICSLRMFDATLKDRQSSFRLAPGTSMFIHWLVGMVYVFYFASFILLLREVLRPGVLWFLRNLNDPDFNPIQEMIHLPMYRHVRRFLASMVIFGSTVLMMLWLPVQIIRQLFPAFLPYNVLLSSDAPVSELSLELLLLQVVLPALLEQGHTRLWLKNLVRGWCIGVAYLLNLRSYLLGDVPLVNDQGHGTEIIGENQEPNANGADPAEEAVEENHNDEEDEEDDTDDDDDDGDDDGDEVEEGENQNVANQIDVDHDAPAPQPAAVANAVAPILRRPVALGAAHQAMLQGGGPTGFQPYQRPNLFTLRLIALISLMCITLFVCSLVCFIVPVYLGRKLMSLWMGETRSHELYTAACGLYTCWVTLRALSILYTWLPQGVGVIFSKISEWVLLAVKSIVLAMLLLGLVPLLLGLLFEQVIVVPLRVPLNQTPIFFPWQDWALGVLHAKIICAITMMGPQWWLKVVIEQVYNQGFRQMDLMFILTKLCIPVIGALGMALAIPYVTARSLLPALGCGEEVENLVLRRIYPFMLGIICFFTFCIFQVRQFKRLYEHIKNDKYLVGQRLVNYEKTTIAAAAAAAAAAKPAS
ncbi:hypothetical protein LSH36_502g01051 [Paralvinella palmiformis]|uniref:RING-type E3 ubiquitin transferase n=1 Tax=Paralvinella palmiformis TaxID=53620 RepID=A0AAD9J8B3_9ANNE|nr:hypothetical protein LSH36_502g01051 [Paralvinella palmiformis]